MSVYIYKYIYIYIELNMWHVLFLQDTGKPCFEENRDSGEKSPCSILTVVIISLCVYV